MVDRQPCIERPIQDRLAGGRRELVWSDAQLLVCLLHLPSPVGGRHAGVAMCVLHLNQAGQVTANAEHCMSDRVHQVVHPRIKVRGEPVEHVDHPATGQRILGLARSLRHLRCIFVFARSESGAIEDPIQVFEHILEPVAAFFLELQENARGHAQMRPHPRAAARRLKQDGDLLPVGGRRRPSTARHGCEPCPGHRQVLLHHHLPRTPQSQCFLLARSREPQWLLVETFKDQFASWLYAPVEETHPEHIPPEDFQTRL